MATTFSRDAVQQRLAGLSSGQRRLLEERLRGRGSAVSGEPEALAIPRRADQTRPARLSFAQEQIWFLQQFEPHAATYNEATPVRLKTRYDRAAFTRAFLEIQRRHELLRSTFHLVGDDAVQVVAPWPTDVQLPFIDLSHLPPDEREAEVARIASEEPLRPFQLDREFPWRVAMVQLAEDDHLLLMVQHHIAYDGWSMEVFIRELLALYAAYAADKPSPLPEPSIQYADFAEWERQWLQGSVLETKLDFWRQRLAGHQNLQLPTDRPRPALPTTGGAVEWMDLEPELVRAVAALAEAHGVTPFMAYLAVFKVLLARYSGQTDIILGTPVANRPRPELEKLIGIFLNSLVLRTDLSGEPTFTEALARVRETAVDAFAHQDLPIEFLVTRVPFERDPTRNPLFQICFNWQDWRHVPMPEFELHALGTGLDSPHVTAKFDLSVFIRVRGEAHISCGWEYNTDLFDAITIQRMTRHFAALLREVVTEANRPISRLPLLADDERGQIVDDWNATARAFRTDASVHALIELQVARTPSAVAVVSGAEQLTYAELDARANALAEWLRNEAVGPGTLVGVGVPRSVEMIVGVLGVLKAGGAYVPIDPEYPEERQAFIREDAGLKLVLGRDEIVRASASNAPAQKLPIDPESIAYVIYTSGSTGQPKGVLVPHRALVSYCMYARDEFGIQPGSRVLQFASLSFDTAAEEIYPCLIGGGTLVLREPDMLGSVEGFLNRCAELEIELLDLPTSYWHEMVACLADGITRVPECVRLVIIGGERALATDRAIWRARVGDSVRLLNTYGPTEATIVALASDLTHVDDEEVKRNVPIGRPVANAQAYILDSHLQPVPIGVPGELYLGGSGISHGYLGRPELTAERFVHNPFGSGRLYRTGDVARWRADGQVEYLGRADQQVKIRGFRIEPAEIESVLNQFPGIGDCVVLARADHLLAFVVGNADLDEVERYARVRLPDYMVPAAFVHLDALPRLLNGKLDRGALPALGTHSERERQYVAPRNSLEATLADIWSQVLGVERVGIHDNFFTLGGHSLLAVRLAARARRALLVELPVRLVFESPTVALLAERVAELPRLDADADEAPIPRAARGTTLPLSFAQERLLRRANERPDDVSNNITQTLMVDGPLDVDALERGTREIVQRHEALRTSFEVGEDGTAVARVRDDADLSWVVEDVTETSVEQRVRDFAEQSFDLAAGPLMRLGVFRIGREEHLLALCVHHICFDGASLDVLCRELSALYRAYSTGGTASLPPLALQYADYAAWQRERAASRRFETDLAYWRGALSGAPSNLLGSANGRRGAGGTLSFTLAEPVTERLRKMQQQDGLAPFPILLAAYQALLARYTNRSDICVGIPVSTRDRDDLHELIGLFLNTVLVRTNMSGDPTFRELVGRVRETTVAAMSHQALPFEVLAAEVASVPAVQAVFTLHPAGRPALELPGAAIRVARAEGRTAKYDLTLSIDDEGETIRGQVEGSAELFGPERVARIAADYQSLLAAALTAPDLRLSAHPQHEGTL